MEDVVVPHPTCVDHPWVEVDQEEVVVDLEEVEVDLVVLPTHLEMEDTAVDIKVLLRMIMNPVKVEDL